MVLQDLFDDLVYGEFSDIALGTGALGTLPEASYPRIASFINMGLRDLYKKFILRKKEIKLYYQTGIYTYYLRSDYVGPVNSLGPNVYLVEDDNNVFDNSIVKVIAAYDSDEDKLPLNAPKDDTSLFTPAYDIIKLPVTDPPSMVTLVYQSYYPKILITTGFDPEEYELHFPSFIENALLAFVASRHFKGKKIKRADGSTTNHNTFLSMYGRACKELEQDGFAEESDDDRDRFTDNGWV